MLLERHSIIQFVFVELPVQFNVAEVVEISVVEKLVGLGQETSRQLIAKPDIGVSESVSKRIVTLGLLEHMLIEPLLHNVEPSCIVDIAPPSKIVSFALEQFSKVKVPVI